MDNFLDIFDPPNILPTFLEFKNGGTVNIATFVVVTAIAQSLQGFIGWALIVENRFGIKSTD